MLRNSIQLKIESMTKKQHQEEKEVITNKPKKLDSALLNKMSKFGTTSTNTVVKRNLAKEKEHQEFEKIEKLSTFEKILKLQNILKEISSMKIRFETNKDQILENINKNTFNYYKSKIKMKEIYDYCQSNNLENNIIYELIPEPVSYFKEKGSDLYKDIYNFLFLIRNNNKMMIKLIDKCEKEDYENLSDYLVNFCYEDTINSSFIQEELMLLIYLVLEKNIINLPNQITNNENRISYNLFRNEENLVYHILRSLSRKADVRNFLCSILLDSLNNLQGIRNYLSLNSFFSKEKSEKNVEDNNVDNILNKSFDNPNPERFSKIDVVPRHYSISNEKELNKLRLSSVNSEEVLTKVQTTKNFTNIEENKNKKEDEKKIEKEEKEEVKPVKDNNSNDEENKDIFTLPENINEEDLGKIEIDSFFENNNVTLNYLQNKIKNIKKISKNNSINLAMKDYLDLLIKDINEEKEEIYSNKKMINHLKLMILNSQKEENQDKSKEKFQNTIDGIKNNYKIITNFIDEIIHQIKENITTVPVIIKCLSNVIEQLLNKKYIERKSNKLITIYQKYNFKSNIFFGNFILCSLKNLNYNGIFTSDVISNIAIKNLEIIVKIFDKMLSGKLFTNCTEIIYNKYIIETIPKFFEIIDNIEKNFKLPDVLQGLVNTCTDINNTKRLKDFEYDYFFEKNEVIRYQSLCFNFDNLLILMKLAKKTIENLSDLSEEEKQIIGKIYCYEKFLSDLNEKTKNNENKLTFIFLSKVFFKSQTEKRINAILRDNFTIMNQSPNENNLSFIKKCLIEVLEYANSINKYNFMFYIQNLKRNIQNQEINNLIFRKNRLAKYERIVNGKNINFEINESDLTEKKLNFEKVLFRNILDFLKLEIDADYNDMKTQRVVFCALYVQTNLNLVPNEYKENNYSKLIMELIKEALEKLNYLNSSILNNLYNKIKEGNKLNLIITSNYLQAKSLEKFKCIEYLYEKSLLPFDFKIEKDENDIIKKVEYIDSEQNNANVDNNKQSKEQLFPNFRNYEGKIDDIVKLEEDCLMAEALKEYFQKLRKIIRSKKIIKRFSKEETESIIVELENHILYKLYDKLYPLKPSKLDEKFYKKCCRLKFITPQNIITDKNIYNEQLWKFSMDYLNEINNKYTPQDKLKVVLKAFGILQNSITFSSGKKELGVDDTIKPLIYVLIKAQPKNIFTNYNYCQLFLNDNLCKTQYGILLTQLYMIMNIIKDMKYTDLIDVSEEKFGKDDDE